VLQNRRNNQLYKSGAGFTIIELLVVISIIGLLATIVLVNLNLPERRRQARIAKSLEFSQTIQNAIGSEAVGIWSFDEGPVNTVVKDSSGNGNDGILNGGVSFDGDTPQKVVGSGNGKWSLKFDGQNGSYVSVNNSASLAITDAITLEAWIKLSNMDTWEYIVAKELDTAYSLPYYLAVNSGNKALIGRIASGGSNTYPDMKFDNTVLNKDTWYHLAGTYDKNLSANNLKIYVDGNLSGQQTLTGGLEINSQPLAIGRLYASGRYFNGFIDEVRIYSQALSANEIQQRYAEGLEKHKNLAIK